MLYLIIGVIVVALLVWISKKGGGAVEPSDKQVKPSEKIFIPIGTGTGTPSSPSDAPKQSDTQRSYVKASSFEPSKTGSTHRNEAYWVPAGTQVTVQGYPISGGMIYVGGRLPDSYGSQNDACLIDPDLKCIAAEPFEGGDQMSYWPKYAEIPPACRGAYLKWLSAGRSEPSAYIGYVFLFFYGLERRLFLDGIRGGIVSEQERSQIAEEVKRLLSIYGNNNSFRGYANNFLGVQWIAYHSEEPLPGHLTADRFSTGALQFALAKTVISEKPIPAYLALQWLAMHPEARLRTPARRCPDEFKKLFTLRYSQKFGDGLTVKPNKTMLKLEYRGASPSVSAQLTFKPELPNPFILTGPIKKLSALGDECCDELESFSRYIARKGTDPKSFTATALLPKELIGDAPVASQIKARLAKACEKGLGFVMVETLYKVLNEQVPPKIGKKECETVAAMVDTLGYGIAPDVRYHGVKLSPSGKVMIFPHGHGSGYSPSKEFRTVCTILRLGAVVSQVDRGQCSAERSVLKGLIRDNRELSNTEKYSLLAFMHWCLITPQGTSGLKQQLSQASEAIKEAISHILVTVALSDGKIELSEIKQLEKLYTMMGLEKKHVTEDLHVLSATTGPVTVGLRDPDTSFSIPKDKSAAGVVTGFSLNQELIKIREEETRLVRGVLEGIFADQEEAEPIVAAALATAEATTEDSGNPLSHLDAAHQAFFNKLLEQETWERASLYEACKKLGLMFDGAMEVINEWAFEHVNAPLIEDGEPVYVDVNLAKELTGATV